MKSSFLPETKIEVEEIYNGQTFKKIRFIVIDLDISILNQNCNLLKKRRRV